MTVNANETVREEVHVLVDHGMMMQTQRAESGDVPDNFADDIPDEIPDDISDDQEDQASHSEYDPSSASETSEVSTCSDYEQYDEVEEYSPLKDQKFIIFLSCLEELFGWYRCGYCGEGGASHKLDTSGTFLAVSFQCRYCLKTTVWRSQPHIGKTPAGNILLSSSIVCAGASATKVIRMLSHMNVASITQRTFFRQQTQFILPSVWEYDKHASWGHCTRKVDPFC